MGSGKGQMFLEYVPSSAQGHLLTPTSDPQQVAMPSSSLGVEFQGDKVRREKWNREQIGDFVRKLGFLDKDKEGGDRIKHFLRLSQVSHAHIPHPSSLPLLLPFVFPLPCTDGVQVAGAVLEAA